MRKTALVATWLVLAFGTVVLVPAAGATDPSPQLQLVILNQDWGHLGLGYEWKDAWPRLQEAAGGDALVRIDEWIVVAYDGPSRTFVLRPHLTPWLIDALRALPGQPERLRRPGALWSSDDLMAALNEHAFVVSFNGHLRYGGIFLVPYSAMAIRYPVAQAELDEDRRIVLHLSPALVSGGDPEERAEIEKRLDKSGITELFRDLGTPARAPSLPKPANPDAVTPTLPLAVTPWPQGDGESWALYFSPPPPGVAAIRYRIADPSQKTPWKEAGEGSPAGLGELVPGAHRVEIETFDATGRRIGTYRLDLDPAQESIFHARNILGSLANVWIELTDREDWDETNLTFGQLAGEAGTLQEARYSLDSCALDRLFPLSDPGDAYLWIPKTVSFVCVQLSWRDGVTSPPRRFVHHRPPTTAVAAVPEGPALAPGPVTLKTSRSNAGWLLIFDLESPLEVREMRYRLGDDPGWTSTGPGLRVNLLNGERFPETSVAVDPLRVLPGRQRLEVKLTDWKGTESGPFVLWFDPEGDTLREGKSQLLDPGMKWATLETRDDQVLFFVSTPFSFTDILREIRYSLNDCKLGERFPFTPWTDLAEPPKILDDTYLWLPKTVKSACLQLVFRDGEVTVPRQYLLDVKD